MSVSRRQFLASSAAALAAPSILRSRLFAMPQQTPPIVTKFEDLRGGVGIFTGSGGTIGWLVTPDGALAVDSQFVPQAQACVDGLRQRSPKGIQLLINTHHHADHVSGNPAFRPVVKSIVQQEQASKLHHSTTTANAADQAYADVTFGGSWSTTLGGEKIWAKYYGPGHTGGDCIVIFEKANIVHMGDLMFNRRHPFIDRPNGASMVNWAKALGKIADDHKDATFIFGHAKGGAPLTGPRAELLHFRDYMTAVLDHARTGIRAGQSLEAITAIKVLPGFEDFEDTPPRLSLAVSLTVAHEELTGK